MPVGVVSSKIARDPFLHRRPVKAHGKELHGLRVAKHFRQRVRIRGHELAKHQARRFKNDLHGHMRWVPRFASVAWMLAWVYTTRGEFRSGFSAQAADPA